MKRVNVLITAASRKVALVKYFKRAVNREGIGGNVIVTDTDPESPVICFADKHYMVPLSSSPDYMDAIAGICAKENISLIVPTIDEEISTFGIAKAFFKDKGVTVLISDKETGDICYDKYATYNFFKERGLPFADSFLKGDIDPNSTQYPLFIKPRYGRGSVGAFPVRNAKELVFFFDYTSEPVVQQFLEGDEFTIDVLADFSGKVISVVPRKRVVIRSGVCDRGVAVKNDLLIEIAKKAAEALNIIGPANLQCKFFEGKATFFEVNPRFSGAIQLTIKAGADFPEMIIDLMLGHTPKHIIGDFEDGLIMSSYEDSVYKGKNDRCLRIV